MADGTFTDLRSHWFGHIGDAGISLARHAGGTLGIAASGTIPPVPARGSEPPSLARLALRVRLVCEHTEGSADHGRLVELRQELDPAPKCSFLEEGPVRVGMRVAFDLLDEEGHYHGDGRQDVWLYREGDVHVTWALHVLDASAHGAVDACWIEVTGDAGYRQVYVGDEELSTSGTELRRSFGEQLAARAVTFHDDDLPPLGLYWVRDAGDVWEVGSDHGRVPPFYASRWPTGMQQWCRGNMGWQRHESAAVTARLDSDGPSVRLAWREGATEDGELVHAASLVISAAADDADLARRIAAVQRPLTPEIIGGDFRCYTEEDGIYEIGQGDLGKVTISYPRDALERVVRVRHYRRKTHPRHRGGVRAHAEGAPLRPQLMSEGELTDDICVPMDMSHRNDSVDDVLVSQRLSAERPTTIVIERLQGVQAAYQSEITGVDLQRRGGNRRDLAVWTHHNTRRPQLEVDLFSGAVHRWTGFDQLDPVIWEMPMAWFQSCGISPLHYCNLIQDFEVLDPGPERLELYWRSHNANGRAQSETWLAVPADHPRPRLEVRLRLEILRQWEGNTVEFSDIFPYPSRLVETWFHDTVLFMQPDATATIYTLRPDTSAHSAGAGNVGPHLFYGLYASDRGNVLAFMENPQHPQIPFHFSVCGNYIDVHVNYCPETLPVPAGTVFEVSYVTELYGDGTTTTDEIRAIGERSLAAGALTV